MLEAMARNCTALSAVPKGNVFRDQSAEDHTAPTSDTATMNDWSHNRSGIVRTTNGVLAANLAVSFPKTPKRVAPNSARKRRPVPNLSRSCASPGHGEKMATIFRDASATFQGLQTPPCRLSPNTRIPGLPLSQARHKRFGSVSQDDATMTSDIITPSRIRGGQELSAEVRLELIDALRSGPMEQQPHTADEVNDDNHLLTDPPLNCQYRSVSPPNRGYPTSVSQIANAGEASLHVEEGREPLSSGFGTPSAMYSRPPTTPEEIKYADFEHWRLSQSPLTGKASLGVGSGASLTNAAERLLLSAASSSDEEVDTAVIEGWLNSIRTSTRDVELSKARHGRPAASGDPMREATNSSSPFRKSIAQEIKTANKKSGVGKRSTSRASSNKENLSPGKSTPSPIRPHIPNHTATPRHFRNPNIQEATEASSALHFAHPLTSQRHLSLPPKRKKPCVGAAKPDPPMPAKDFTIHNDQVADALAQLSPDVELRRKGRRPKRERCTSYWDQDILSPGSPCLPTEAERTSTRTRKGKTVLGESQQTAEMTKEKPFTTEAEDADFSFQA